MKMLIKKISNIVEDQFEQFGYDREYGTITISNRPDLCQFQCNGALSAAKQYKKAPVQIANEILEELKKIEAFQDVSIAGPGFININIEDRFLTEYINEMYNNKKLGCDEVPNPKTIIIDYGGANVAKPLHVGHLRSAIIGESLKRISKFMGHNVIGDVHLGDWGLQIGMVISELRRRNPDLPYFDESFQGDYSKEAPFTIDELEEIYPTASKLAKTDSVAMEESKKATSELQKGRRGYVELWKHILNVSVADLKKGYGNLNVHFDLWKGESDSQKYVDGMVKYLKDNNYTSESEGLLIVDVAKEADTHIIPPFIVLKSDGASLYSTTDLATIWERVEEYAPDQIIYVVDKRQDLHFEQVFRCAKKTKIAGEALKLEFIGFGTMNGKDGKPFKTREGGVMRLQDLIQIIKDAVKDKLQENKSIDFVEADEIARKVGLSALKYGDLSNQATKDYVFDIERFSSFEGNTGPYILYTVVRIKSILRRITEEGFQYSNKINTPYSNVERSLFLKLSKFNEVVELSFKDKAPNKICDYVYDLASTFNRFYHDNKIIAEENIDKKASWINLISLTMRVLETGLDLLGIETPERM
ncbi:arginyl-tRNA synthetase [Anaerosolibacter carboniphilus]|uniref:Arginine--tRNA ligase n=1 Tax=Anaerosolibacter carboniphilus TaxID=1417629 RepID=A0A841KX15_9FIRM|nr:arginine--tRNA ligase [Anaerosolibacter carboniphilus]MBB6217991.1 arginyl-tRNA synthetase [Anaerosolibacter carboniphilus]